MTAVSANALTLTTESDGEVTVPLVDATTYTRSSMGGQAPDSNPPEMPGNYGDSGDQAAARPRSCLQATQQGRGAVTARALTVLPPRNPQATGRTAVTRPQAAHRAARPKH